MDLPLFAKRTKADALLDLLSDGAWHSMRELQAVAGWRYGGRLHDLKRRGVGHEIKRDEAGCYWYRIAGREKP